MNADEAGQIGRNQAVVLNEWRMLVHGYTARIGQDSQHLSGEVVQAMALLAAKEEDPELYERAVKAEADFTELEARSRHAIARSEERWTEMDQKSEERRRRELEQKKDDKT